jgi:hypothetical protein
MKKISYIVLVATLMAACTQTPQQKAEALVEETVKKVLFKPDTYDPIETKLDSIVSPYNDPDFYKEVTSFSELLTEVPRCENRIESTKKDLNFYDKSFKDSFFKNEYQEAKEKYEKAVNKYENLKEKIQKKYEGIAKKLKGEHAFSGYVIAHSFRANNNDGQTQIGNYIFFVDKNIENILYTLNDYEANEFAETIGQIREKMESDEDQWFSDDDDDDE